MGSMSILAVAGTPRDIAQATCFPENVKFDKVVKIPVPDDHGEFPDLSAYDREDFADFESKMEDNALFRYMTQCVDAVLDFTVKNADRLEKLNYRNINTTMAGMNTGGNVFVVAGFVDYEPLWAGKSRSSKGIIYSPSGAPLN